MQIIVKDKINSSYAVSAEKGKIIYDLIVNEFNLNNNVILNFEGIASTISTFFNSSYAILFKDYSEDFIDKNLHFINLKEITEHQIKAVKENAIKFYKKGE